MAAFGFRKLGCQAGGSGPCCESGDCIYCNGETPTQFQVDITGIVNGTSCVNCGNLNTTFILAHDENDLAIPYHCCYEYPLNACFTFSPTFAILNWCDGGMLFRTYYIIVGFAWDPDVPEYYIYVRLQLTAYGNTIYWKKSYASKPSCTQSGLDIPFLSQTSTSLCNAANATCTITAL